MKRPRFSSMPVGFPTTFIYGLVDPRDKTIRYVGKSNHPQERLKQHLKEKPTSTYKNSWIRYLLKRGLCPELILLEEVFEDRWEEAERYWISYFRDYGYRIVNGTSGGDGISNPSEEIRSKISESVKQVWQDEDYRENILLVRKATYARPEVKKKMSLAAKKNADPKRMSKQAKEAAAARADDPEKMARYVEVMGDGVRRSWQDPEIRRRHAEGTRRAFCDPEVKKRCSEAQKLRWSIASEDEHKKQGDHGRGKPLPDEVREKIRKAALLQWANRKAAGFTTLGDSPR